jgi:hypothetical protein
MSNGFASRAKATPASVKWFRHVKRVERNRRTRHNMDAMLYTKAQLRDDVRPPAEPPPMNTQRDSAMTGYDNPDHESVQHCSNLTSNANIEDDDSICGIPPLCRRFDDSSDEELDSGNDSLVDIPPLTNRTAYSSDDSSDEDSLFHPPPLATCSVDSSDEDSIVKMDHATRHFEVETVTSESSFGTAQEDDALSISTTNSVLFDFDDIGPPPPGSIMELWDTPFSTSCLHNFASRYEDAKCYFLNGDTSDTESTSDSSLEISNDSDSYAEFNPVCPHPILSLTKVTATMQLVGLGDNGLEVKPNK